MSADSKPDPISKQPLRMQIRIDLRREYWYTNHVCSAQPATKDHLASVRSFIQDALDSGALQPGQKLPTERDLAERFGVARSVVRAALAPLEAKGRISREIGRGTYVLPTNDRATAIVNEIDASPSQLIEAARSCYPFMCEVAASTATRADLQAIADCARKVVNARGNDEYRIHDAAFHMAIAQATQNPILVELAAVIARAQSHLHWGEIELGESAPDDHEKILEALMKRNGKLARNRMESHLSSADVVVSAIEQ